MSRKDITITDENYDEQFEKICEEQGFPYGSENNFVEKLPDDFTKIDKKDDPDDCDYQCTKLNPDHSSDCANALQDIITAWEFANGFITIHREYVI